MIQLIEIYAVIYGLVLGLPCGIVYTTIRKLRDRKREISRLIIDFVLSYSISAILITLGVIAYVYLTPYNQTP
ncbi:MAG: hypothetical protein HKN00_00160 [Flavobacteriaceae bacterium]|nr:hypothetical protein [Bacteroidia bacterium]MBT8286533.1 hypothetical protein [Bacteroidia bacterium]NNF73567.1 hypothetical protein [Flavobacteriaceae bacterium]NNK73105.1 hypothetical protein [Flavobacteriaceae bacterium]